MLRVIACVTVCAAASVAVADPFSWSLIGPATVPPGATPSIFVDAFQVTGIGAVSGFADLIIQVSDPAGVAQARFVLIPPFDDLGQGNGATGVLLTGLSGGQAAFPPAVPISFSPSLFRIDLFEIGSEERNIVVTVSGLGGVFLNLAGTSTVPFEPVASRQITVTVIPAPGSAVLGLGVVSWCAGRRRRARIRTAGSRADDTSTPTR